MYITEPMWMNTTTTVGQVPKCLQEPGIVDLLVARPAEGMRCGCYSFQAAPQPFSGSWA